MNIEKLKQMQEQVRIGGKGSVRRKKKIVNKEHVSDDRKIQTTLKKIGLTEIPCIDEVVMFKNNGDAMCFNNPKLMALPSANTFAITGPVELKAMNDMWPLLNKFTMDNFPMMHFTRPCDAAIAAICNGPIITEQDSEDDIPDLVENFDEAMAME